MDRDLIKIAETVYKPLIAREVLRYKQAEDRYVSSGPDGISESITVPDTGPSMKDRASALMGSAMEAGKYYGPSAGYGAGAGALAGIPLGLLAQAMFGEDNNLRAYLRSALLGGLGGAGVGALGGAGLQHYNPELAQSLMNKVDSGIGGAYTSISDAIKGLFPNKPEKVEPSDPNGFPPEAHSRRQNMWADANPGF